ncbi:MAG: glycosyltransferase, partial [Bosea sp. (in: a-proteobacteria)]|nr:glycosyltransferase [Bosea sp. (in: a-proteobacteria)]
MTLAESASRAERLLEPVVSIVICTDGRPKALAATLQSLLGVEGPLFEVVIVRGPTEDGIAEVLEQWRGRIKVAHNNQRN